MNFLPVTLDFPFERPMIVMENLPESVFEHSFFDANRLEYIKENKVQKKILTQGQFKDYLKTDNVSAPAGFIFHPSRAGSTLLCRMLACMKRNRVMCEPHIINKFMISKYIYRQDYLNELSIGDLIKSFTSVDNQQEDKKLIIKFPSWMIHFMPQILNEFPNTPWIYLYRNPAEIIVSNLDKPYLLNKIKYEIPLLGSYLARCSIQEIEGMDIRVLGSKVLHNNMLVAKEQSSYKHGLFVSYKSIKSSFKDRIISHFNLKLSDEDRYTISNLSKYNSKDKRQEIFIDDRKEKQEKASNMGLVMTDMISLYYDMNKTFKS